MIVKILFFLLLTNVLAFSQETQEITAVESVDKKEKLITPDIGELKYRFMKSDLNLEEVFTLASLYLSERFYYQSIELYSYFLNHQETLIKDTNNSIQVSFAFYNKALALFSLELYDSALTEFYNAYAINNKLYDSIRMIGTIYFQKKDKDKALEYWNNYLVLVPESTEERNAIEKAVQVLQDLNFQFEKQQDEKQETSSQTWPFLNPDIIPNPDSEYEKKRVI